LSEINLETDFYKSILENQGELILRFTTDGKITYVNHSFSDSIHKASQKLVGKDISVLFSAKQLPHLHRSLKEMLMAPRRMPLDVDKIQQNGMQCLIRWEGFPITTDQNKIIEIQVVGTDVTNLLHSEEMLEIQRDLALSLNESKTESEYFEILFKTLSSLSFFSLFALYVFKPKKDLFLLDSLNSVDGSSFHFPTEVTCNSPSGIFLLKPNLEFYSANAPLWLDSAFELPPSIKDLVVLPLILKKEPIATFILGTSEFTVLPEEIRIQLQAIIREIEHYHSRLHIQIESSQQEIDHQTLFQTLDQMVLVTNGKGEILDMNLALQKRVSVDEASGKKLHIFDLHPDEYHDRLSAMIKELKREIHNSIRIPLINPVNQKIIIEVEVDFSYGSMKGEEVIIAFYKDISQQNYLVEMEKEQRDFTSKLVEIASALNSSLDLDVVLDHILASIDKVVPTQTCNILLVEGTTGRVVRQHGYDRMGTAEILASRIFDLQKITSFVKILAEKQEMVISDTRNYSDWIPMPESFWVRSYICAPIVVNGQVFGFLNCDGSMPDSFTEKHAKRLKMVADQAAIAIENAQVFAETNRRLKQIALINEFTQMMLNSKQLDDVLANLPEKVLSVFDANSLMITKWDPENKTTTNLAAYGDGLMPAPVKLIPSKGPSITEKVIDLQRPLVITTKKEYAQWQEYLSPLFSDQVFLILPMIAQENPLGAIVIGFKNPRQITQPEISLGEYASLQIATIIHKSNIYEKTRVESAQFQHANDLITSLSFVATSILSTKGLEDIIQTMGEGLEKMNIHSLLFFLNKNSQLLSLDYCSHNKELLTQLKALNYSTDRKIIIPVPNSDEFRNTLEFQQIVFVEDLVSVLKMVLPGEIGPFIGKIQEALDIKKETKSLFLPLIVDRKTIGLLGLYGKDLQEIDLKASEIFNSQISVAIENSRLLAEVQRLAITDELTAIYNRRGLFELGERELAVSKRSSRPLSALMIDLDNFKEINDKHGHAIGDIALSEIAQKIASYLREIDIVGRYGGEEFVVLLKDDDLPAALIVAERIRKTIASDLIYTEAGPIHVTVSIGADELDSMTANLETLIKRADRALYIAKHNGRNQVATLMNLENSRS
jgi:diguanylate cyclase (GGDEF)-like protein/PAS domain S-box-containing protein